MSEETPQVASLVDGSDHGTESAPPTAPSTKKLEANRRNAQHSTGPKTAEGKAKSAQNAIKYGIFAKRFLCGASGEAVAEMETLISRVAGPLSAGQHGGGTAGRKSRHRIRALRTHFGCRTTRARTQTRSLQRGCRSRRALCDLD